MRGDLDDYPDVEPLPSPNTWETVIEDDEYSLPVFAPIRNPRSMLEASVDEENNDSEH